MFKLIKTAGNNDSLTLFLKDNESVLCIKIEKIEKNSITNYRLNLMDLHEDNIEIPPATFDSVITMPSRFPEDLRYVNKLMILRLRVQDNQLIFNCKGHFAEQETCIGEANIGLTFLKNQNPAEIVQGVFALKHLNLFYFFV